MKLIGSHTSPYTRKARVVLAEKKIDYEFVLDSPWTPDTHVPDHNPLGKIPVLILDDETVIFDSRVIVDYLDNMTPNNKLFPGTNRERIEAKRWEAVADGILDAAVAVILERKRAAKVQDKAWITRQMDKVARSLDFMAAELGEQAWCMGTHFGMADVAAGCALGYLDFRFPEYDWRVQHPNLARFAEKSLQRPSFADTLPHD